MKYNNFIEIILNKPQFLLHVNTSQQVLPLFVKWYT